VPEKNEGFCPNCRRRLLTVGSALCNWCGAKLDDPELAQRAAEARQALDQAERAALDETIQEEILYGFFGRMKRRKARKPPPTPFG
jgi:predicted amidophosphoribosyltransferase